MGSEIVFLIFVPISFFIILNFILSSAISDASQPYIEILQCNYPQWNSTYSECGLTHGSIYENDQYILWNNYTIWPDVTLWSVGLNFFSDNSTNVWTAEIPAGVIPEGSIPNGWYTYSGDWLSVMFAKVYAVLSLIAIPLSIGAVITSLSFMWSITIPLYISLGIGIYLLVHPLK